MVDRAKAAKGVMMKRVAATLTRLAGARARWKEKRVMDLRDTSFRFGGISNPFSGATHRL